MKFSAALFPPAGVTVQASDNALTAATTLDTPPGTYTITVTGDSGGVQRSAELRVTVHSNAQTMSRHECRDGRQECLRHDEGPNVTQTLVSAPGRRSPSYKLPAETIL